MPTSDDSSDEALRIDRLLCYLRFARTRTIAADWVGTGQMRCNGERILKASQAIRVGDVLTLPPRGNPTRGKAGLVTLVEIVSLPERRGPPHEAQNHYRKLD